MDLDVITDISWLGVIVATIVYMILGALWYGPLFGKSWMRATGFEMPDERPGPEIYIVPMIAYLVASVATAMLSQATGSSTFGEGLLLGLVVGIGYAVTLTMVSVAFSSGLPEPRMLFFITASFNLVALTAGGVFVTVI
jgi:hypothetical protein